MECRCIEINEQAMVQIVSYIILLATIIPEAVMQHIPTEKQLQFAYAFFNPLQQCTTQHVTNAYHQTCNEGRQDNLHG